ncbi:hypothetical protein MMC17_009631, partial [Xylographa soralifera]|nr:hypothetical protein [Xylographa soralifera]
MDLTSRMTKLFVRRSKRANTTAPLNQDAKGIKGSDIYSRGGIHGLLEPEDAFF